MVWRQSPRTGRHSCQAQNGPRKASSGLLTCRDERLAKLYSANINSEVYKDLKKYYTIKKLRESGFLEAVNKSFASSVILLCGPAAAGSDVESDSIDILVISGKKETIADKTVFEQKLKRQLRIFAAASFSEVAQDFLKEVGNWTVIQGSLPLLSVVSGKSDYVPKKPSKPESLHRKYIQ